MNEFKNCDFFKGLTEDDIAKLLFSSPGSLRKYKDGDYVAHQGEICDKIAILTKGKVCTVMVNDYGKELILADIHSPSMLGYIYLFASDNKFNVNIVAKSSIEFDASTRYASYLYLYKRLLQSGKKG